MYTLLGDSSLFIGDVTIPDGLVIPPLTQFEKIWRVKNNGTVPWVRRRLARTGAVAGMGIPSSPAYTPIAETLPGETVDIVVPILAGPVDMTSQVRWKMIDEQGNLFFPDRYWYGLMMTIVVRKDAPPYVPRRLLD